MAGVEYQVTKVDPTNPETKGMVYQVHKVSEEVAATMGGKIYRARIIKDPTEPTVAGKVYQIVLIGDPDDPSVKGKVYNAILTGDSEVVVVGPAVSPLNLPDAIADSLSYVKAFGGTEQNGTPTPDTPMDIVSNNGVLKVSRNKVNVITDNVVVGKYISVSGVLSDSEYNFTYMPYVPVKPNTTYTLSFSSPLYFASVSEYSSAEDAGFVVRQTKYSTSAVAPFDLTEFTFTTGATTNYIRFGSNMYKAQTLTIDDVLALNYMLAESAAAVPYAPYVSDNGGIYTDGTVETIAVHSKNLFDSSLFDTDVGNTLTYVTYSIPNGTYTMSSPDYPQETTANVFVLPGEVTTGASASNNGVWISRPRTITVTDGKYTIAYRNKVGGNQNNPADYNWQLESGLTATSYVSYFNGGTATAEMLLKVGDYQDVQSIIDGAVTRNVGALVLDGTEGWSKHPSVAGWFQLSDTSVLGDITNGFCTHYPYSTTQSSGANQQYYSTGRAAPATQRIIIRDDINFPTSDLDAFKSWLADQYAAGTPVIVVYPLATATTESVAGQTLQVTDGDNTLEITQASLTGLELEAEYEKEGA